MIRLENLRQAEEALDGALEKLRSFSRNPDEWSAHQRLGEDDRRELVLHKAHFEKLEALQLGVEHATNRLRAMQATFAGGGL